MSQIRRETGRALVVRPTRPGDGEESRPRATTSIPAACAEDESGEHISVSRTMTPTDRQLLRAIDEMRDTGDPSVVKAFESIARAARQQRRAYEKEIAAERAELEAATARLAAIEHNAAKWRTPIQLVKGIGFGSVLAALVFVANALIAHGDASAMSRKQAEMVVRHESAISQLTNDLARDRAQDAADHALLTFIAARLGAATP